MSFNYAAERNRFDANWNKLRQEYATAGMEAWKIEEMYRFDLAQFNADRAYEKRRCDLDLLHEETDDTSEFETPMLKQFFEQFTTEYDACGVHNRHWWLEELEDPRLVSALPKLTAEDVELLTLVIAEGYTQKECAVKLEISQCAINKRIARILGKFTEK